MSYKNNKIDFINNMLNNSCNKIEELICSEAIILLQQDVNPDKVINWLYDCINSFNNKPKALTLKQKKKKQIKQRKLNEKKESVVLLKSQVLIFLDSYDVLLLAFMDYKTINLFEYKCINRITLEKGYHMLNIGDGADEIIFSKRNLDTNFLSQYKIYLNKLDALNLDIYDVFKYSVLNDKNKLLKLVNNF